MKSITQEIKLHKSLDHPNILKLHESFEDDHYIYIILERCSLNNLYDLLLKKIKFSFGDCMQ